MTILDQIRRNDPSLAELHLNDLPTEYFEEVSEITAALSLNTVIEKIRFDEDFIGCMRCDAKSILVQRIGDLKSLKEAYLGETTLLVTDLTELVLGANGLKSLRLKDVVLQGLQYEFDKFEKAILQHKNLKEFCMTCVSTANEDIMFDKTLKVLESTSNLDFSLEPTLTSKGAIAA